VWSFGPLLLAIGTVVLAVATIVISGRGKFLSAMPFMALVIIWIVWYFVVRVREQRELQREIDGLNDIERENRL
jgi:hypothetical protein